MKSTFPDALHADAMASELGDVAAQPAPSPLETWSEQAIDACAPEGGYSPYIGTADARAMGFWS